MKLAAFFVMRINEGERDEEFVRVSVESTATWNVEEDRPDFHDTVVTGWEHAGTPPTWDELDRLERVFAEEKLSDLCRKEDFFGEVAELQLPFVLPEVLNAA